MRYYNGTANIGEELKAHREEFYDHIYIHSKNESTLISVDCWSEILHICMYKTVDIEKTDYKYLQSQTKNNRAYSRVKVYDVFTYGASKLVV